MLDKAMTVATVIFLTLTILIVILLTATVIKEPKANMSEYARESALDEYNTRDSYTDYERVDVSDRFME